MHGCGGQRWGEGTGGAGNPGVGVGGQDAAPAACHVPFSLVLHLRALHMLLLHVSTPTSPRVPHLSHATLPSKDRSLFSPPLTVYQLMFAVMWWGRLPLGMLVLEGRGWQEEMR